MTAVIKPTMGLLMAATMAWGGGGAAWETNSYQDFLKGRFEGVSLTRDGRLTLAPALETLASTGEAGVWSVVAAPDGTLYYATGHRGRVYELKPGGQPKLLWTAPLPEVFALALDGRGRLYAAASPKGKVYRIEGGKAAEYFDPGATYVWALAAGGDGALYVATGDEGRIWRVGADGRGEVWYETGQAHVTALALDGKGRLLAGTEPNGILYRVEAKGKAFVLYDSSLPEIRGIVAAKDGSVYVAALGGTLAQKQAQAAAAASAAQPAAGMVTTTITVTADASAQAGVDLKPKPEAAKPATGTTEMPPPAPVVDLSAERAAIYRVWPDQTVETLWSSKEENVYDLTVRAEDLLFSTDQRGRIYRLSPDQKAALVVETREGETTRLVEVPGGVVAATANLGKLYKLNGAATAGTYESAVHDAGAAARWGRLNWRAEAAADRLAFRTRTGNTVRPDATWSEWSEAVSEEAKAAITSPNARYIQWKLELKPGPGPAPLVDAVEVSYQGRNGRPVVRSVQVAGQWVAAAQKAAAPVAAAVSSYSITVTDSGDAAAATSAGTPTQTVPRGGAAQLYITWQADDPDGDKLVYDLHYRAVDERAWKLLKADIAENTYMAEADAFGDARYLFRVTASDRGANSAAAALEGELVSQPVLVDQTAPRVTVGAPRTTAAGVEIDVEARDEASAVRRAEYALNGGPWRGVDAVDGIADSKEEKFAISLPAGTGERTVVVRVTDAAGNAALARVVLR